jgi:hypothetical protein
MAGIPITDAPLKDPLDGNEEIAVNSGGSDMKVTIAQIVQQGAGAINLTDLADTPDDYVGANGYLLAVASDGSGTVFIEPDNVGITEHNALSGRDELGSHPITAITDLQTSLDAKYDKTGGAVSGSILIDCETNNEEYAILRDLGGQVYGYMRVTDVDSSGIGSVVWGSEFDGSPVGEVAIRQDGVLTYNGHVVYHSGNLDPADYLPLSGGTLSGNVYIRNNSPGLFLTSTQDDTNEWKIQGTNTSFSVLHQLSDGTGTPVTIFQSSLNALKLLGGTGGWYIDGNEIWHAGNYPPADYYEQRINDLETQVANLLNRIETLENQ